MNKPKTSPVEKAFGTENTKKAISGFCKGVYNKVTFKKKGKR
jgi:hypothetical protein